MSPEEIIKFRERLDQEAEELRRADTATAADRAPVELDQTSVGRLSRMDAMQQQAMASASARRRAGRLRAIEAALRRMEIDEFGWCQDCGEAIAKGRMELDPTSARCIDCASG